MLTRFAMDISIVSSNSSSLMSDPFILSLSAELYLLKSIPSKPMNSNSISRNEFSL